MAMLSNLRPFTHECFYTLVPELKTRWQTGNHAPCTFPEIANPSSTGERWASYVLGACKSEKDPRTLGIWARQVAVSYTTLCESCRLIDVQPRHARDFARVLRLLITPAFDCRQLATFLDISDRRTLWSILQRAGFGDHPPSSPQVPVTTFLENQQFISHENPGLRILSRIFAPTQL